jgi:hypothetical protein
MFGDNHRVDNLAETLKRCGLAMSASEAMRMAKSIASTEAKVSKDFDNKRSVVEEGMGRRKYNSPQEEINDIIERTSFENKNYFVPIAGYNVERRPREQVQMHIVPEAPAVTKPIEDVHMEPAPEEAPAMAPQAAAPPAEVYTDAVADSRPLAEVLGVTNAAPSQTEQGTPLESREKEVESSPGAGDAAPRELCAAPTVQAVEEKKEEPEFIIKEVAEEKPEKKEFAHPVDKVDLMSHFNFGAR